MYMTVKRYSAAGPGFNSLRNQSTSNFWTPPADGTPVGPNAGYLKVLAATCGGCDSIRF